MTIAPIAIGFLPCRQRTVGSSPLFIPLQLVPPSWLLGYPGSLPDLIYRTFTR